MADGLAPETTPLVQPRRGRLKIFLGAAPGVGKTYEMLLTARARLADGADVVIGVVETHGRKETAALIEGFATIPQRSITHASQTLAEMDLDAILARHPALVLVDELAHTNAPGSRHPKRWMDVEELLAAGIDVMTTLNIQHVESLNDVVARITRIRVRETVPDAVLDAADDIEVVDLAPDDLIQRLTDGKVYVPDQARRALEKFFTRGNLTALRELALRRTAERVDDALLDHMRSHAIRGPWPAGERILVCVNADHTSAGLVRYAKRLADRQRAPWIALYVETPREAGLSDEVKARVGEALHLAGRLGGEAVTVPGGAIAEDILAFARDRNVTQIVIGKSRRSWWFEFLNGSVAHQLVRHAGTIAVSVVAGDEAPAGEAPLLAPPPRPTNPFPWLAYAVATLVVAFSTAAGLLIQPIVGLETIDLVYLVGILAVAARYGTGPSLFASVAAALGYNFFFIAPVHTFTIADPKNIAAFAVFTIVSLVVSQLAARVRAQIIAARARARTTEALYTFSRKIADAASLDDLLWAVAFQIASMLRLEVVLLMPENGQLVVRAAYPPDDEIDEADLGAARWAFDRNREAGRGADTLPGAHRLFVPLATAKGAVGVAGLAREKPGPLMTPDGKRLLNALLGQAAVAIERIALARDMEAARVETETERLRSALLASLSHDLKTPLASIIGAAASLREYGALLDPAGRADLVATIEGEGTRMARFVSNLLDMSRLESGAIRLDRTPVDLADQAASAVARVAPVLGGHAIALDLAGDLPLVLADAMLLEQVLVNLLENAAKYAPAGTAITVSARRSDGGVVLDIADEGPGLRSADLERVFEKYYRAADGDRRQAGAGLGLAICRGFMTAMGGSIAAANRTDRSGAVFTLTFPPPLVVANSGAESAA
ncbi:Sensor protein KdpD [Alphaproteobacteria bacterium SO-S41]|nr:Sensor protein KdpD [Alphaproteobacteria bacterium SO-S41]